MKKKITAALLCLGLLVLPASQAAAESAVPTTGEETADVSLSYMLPSYLVTVPKDLDFGDQVRADGDLEKELKVSVQEIKAVNDDPAEQAWVESHYRVNFDIYGGGTHHAFVLLQGTPEGGNLVAEYKVYKFVGTNPEEVPVNGSFATLAKDEEQTGKIVLSPPDQDKDGVYKGVLNFSVSLKCQDTQ
ncbi:hypothetical protein [Eubacterium sp. 1001713B170207_170306_E7]|uniref:hypothetical protein n=1 Tax=Eubacterium sp. 1001713B170207_170306_E7 TaxID=2787097 RepID=UPI00189941AF|nr:hypothetical protein [Eubacterium sp. 1001713B170207_170306_E7]